MEMKKEKRKIHDERIVICGIPIIFDHKEKQILLNSNIEPEQLNRVCAYLVAEGFMDDP